MLELLLGNLFKLGGAGLTGYGVFKVEPVYVLGGMGVMYWGSTWAREAIEKDKARNLERIADEVEEACSAAEKRSKEVFDIQERNCRGLDEAGNPVLSDDNAVLVHLRYHRDGRVDPDCKYLDSGTRAYCSASCSGNSAKAWRKNIYCKNVVKNPSQ